jgi:hypothetical protein
MQAWRDAVEVVDEDSVEVLPLVVIAQTFPARPSSIPEIRDFVNRCLADSPLSEEDSRAVAQRVSAALLEAAGPTGTIQVSFRIMPDHAEVDVLRSAPGDGPGYVPPTGDGRVRARIGESTRDEAVSHDEARTRDAAGTGEDGKETGSFADWMGAALRREGLTMEAAARQLGVSVKTVSRWVGGTTEPRLRDLRRIQQLLGDLPFP